MEEFDDGAMLARTLRWLLALGVWGFCAFIFANVLAGQGGYTGIPPLLLAFGLLIAGVVLVARDVAVPIGEFFAEFILEAILPGGRFDKPPLSYVLAHRYRDQLRFPEAVAEYRKIIRYYPDERTAYEELMAVAVHAGDKRTARFVRRKFARRFGKAEKPSLPVS